MKTPLILSILLATGACQTVPVGGDGGALAGNWGGDHVGLTLDTTHGALEYDCASGEIAGPVVPDRAGRFVASGVHIPGHGGPDRIDYVPPRKRATYAGQVTGDRMVLTVRVEDGVLIGPLTLVRGAEPRVFRCL